MSPTRNSVAYFDTAFVVKCYVSEDGCEAVRAAASVMAQLVTSELARAEFAAAIHRKRREHNIVRRDASAFLTQFDTDCADGVWSFVPVSSAVIARAWGVLHDLPTAVYLRAADAIHCASAVEFGLPLIYSSDRHVLKAALHFKLKGIDVTVGAGS